MENNSKQKSVFYYVFKFAGSEKSNYIKTIIFALIGVIFSLVPFFLASGIVKNLVAGEKDFKVYQHGLLLIAVFFIVRVVFHTLSTTLSHKTTFRLLKNIRIAILDKLERMPLGTIEAMSSGSLKNTIVERVDSMETTLAHIIPEVPANLAAPLLIFIYLLILDWRMGLLSLVTFPVGALAMMWMMSGYTPRFQKTQDATKNLNNVAVEYIGGIEVIKAFGKAEASYGRFVKAARESAYSFIDWMKSCLVPHSLMMTVTPATLLAVLPVGALFTLHGSLALSDFVMIIALATGLITPLFSVLIYMDDMAKAVTIFGEIDAVLEADELDRPKESVKTPVDFSIRLDHVSFSYDEKEVLHDVSLEIPQGKVTALVGPSGSGKSTIARLIMSLWDVNKGTIKIGDVNIKNLSFEDLNKYTSFVSQNAFLFDTTVRENIRMGNLQASDMEVEACAKLSGCYDFIMALENGFDTNVGGGGAHLSGGEKQRISIARAMMKNAPILILDEATAYTDPENEAIIQKAIEKLTRGKTLIVIAHRLSTVTGSDQIAVIDDGKVSAIGTHDELLQSSALYANMWNTHIGAKDTGLKNNELGGAL